jgi:chloride channel 3/4/5
MFRALPSHNDSDISLTIPSGHLGEGSLLNDAKEFAPLDWYSEGPGRRVGYDDLTAIDWIFEYTKERLRLRLLDSNAQGVFGYAQQLFDASQIWLILIGTGLTSGLIAACIDLASSWLSDLKMGYCQAGAGGGQFYLNKGFCCWELEGKYQRLLRKQCRQVE